MPSKRIEAALRRLLEGEQEPGAQVRRDPSAGAELEAQLMTRFERRYPVEASAEAAGLGMFAFARLHRWAVASVGLGLAAVGACYAPAELDVPLGITVGFLSADEHPEALVEEIVSYVEESTGATQVQVEATKRSDGPLQIQLRVWGPGVPADLDEELSEAFPQLEQAHLSTEPLAGRVHTTLGRRLGHRWLALGLAEDDLEEARVELIAQLAAEGVDGDVDVEILERDGHREVRVRVEQRTAGD